MDDVTTPSVGRGRQAPERRLVFHASKRVLRLGNGVAKWWGKGSRSGGSCQYAVTGGSGERYEW
jgi:hypothetical protein